MGSTGNLKPTKSGKEQQSVKLKMQWVRVSNSIAKIGRILITNPSLESEFGTNKKAWILKETRPLFQKQKDLTERLTG